jgi:hypothetical protein
VEPGRPDLTPRHPVHVRDQRKVRETVCRLGVCRSRSHKTDRDKSTSGSLVRVRAARRYQWLREIIRYVRSFVDLPALDFPPVDVLEDPNYLTPDRIEEIATATRRHWNLGDGPISNLVMLLENKGVIVVRRLDCDALADGRQVNGTAHWKRGNRGTALRDLCSGIHNAPQLGKGRPRLPLSDVTFAAVFKVFSTFSGRRFVSDLRSAHERGYIRKPADDRAVLQSPEFIRDALVVRQERLPWAQSPQ